MEVLYACGVLIILGCLGGLAKLLWPMMDEEHAEKVRREAWRKWRDGKRGE